MIMNSVNYFCLTSILEEKKNEETDLHRKNDVFPRKPPKRNDSAFF